MKHLSLDLFSSCQNSEVLYGLSFLVGNQLNNIYHLFITINATIIIILPLPFSSVLKNRSVEYFPCQMCHQMLNSNSKGKTNYSKVKLNFGKKAAYRNLRHCVERLVSNKQGLLCMKILVRATAF